MKAIYKIIFLAAFLTFSFAPLSAQGQFIFDENPLIKKQAPDFTLNLISGQTMSLNKYRAGDPAIIFFWATWCPHCREELRTLEQQEDIFKKSGIKIILVNVEENPHLVKAFMDKIKLSYPVFLDERSEISEQYSIVGLPTLFFIDRNGVIIGMEHALPDDVAQIFGPLDNNKK